MEWTDEELIGACKAADDGLDETRSWDDYSSDPEVVNTGDMWTVTISALDGSDSLICEVTGTPESSTVSFR
ncbi:hypothetical protein ACFSBZ_13890 [Amnibacterium flavum]|uniref:Uncharacterized protein n=1 Tax=Amnibacterium flavum TaxID=2173173 RepID=A0A2V1HU54_9MICO|nr:hypothetical protein [Amnibacterium flavum]PVZ95841.1 hypothetical protein DDQ50_05095 [Amnibacterium flavum]